MVEKSRTKIIEVCACDCLMCEECEGFEDAGTFRNKEVAEQVAQELAEEAHYAAIKRWNALNNPGHSATDPTAVSTRFNETAVKYIQKHLVLDDSERAALIAKVAQW